MPSPQVRCIPFMFIRSLSYEVKRLKKQDEILTDINLSGKLIYLRPMEEKDTDLIVKWRNHERVRRNFIYQKSFTKEGHENWIHTMIETGSAVQFIICEKETNRPVGSVYFRDINTEHHKAEYGIFIGEDDAVGKGIGTETARLAILYGFRAMNLHKIILRAFAENEGALRSYEKAGFVREALLKEEVCIEGCYRDIVLMGIINPDESAQETV